MKGKSPSEHHADHGHRRITQTGGATPYDDGGSDLPFERKKKSARAESRDQALDAESKAVKAVKAVKAAKAVR